MKEFEIFRNKNASPRYKIRKYILRLHSFFFSHPKIFPMFHIKFISIAFAVSNSLHIIRLIYNLCTQKI